MQENKTHFIHIFGYGLIALWIMALVIFPIIIFAVDSFNIYSNLNSGLEYLFYASIYFIPFAALIALIVGGIAWLILRGSSLSNMIKSIIAGGMSSSLPVVLGFGYIVITENEPIPKDIYVWLFIALLCSVGGVCGWLGERLARRHIKYDPNSIPKTFE